ncbi:MAG: hypothetical protein A2268_02195 [Candidatus Raymondbacteria bacterium RifOxyA12_full_50_37]|uniref:Sulfatase-modifying factor enzyme-like domain-containing protein n=1 Tax=Candidatus Raymondbacteria bacterium RIFOXYD12_FULL_49_13 TaxID=1817890 RepID=A0A1F7F5C4_UNCRA|nr:MAG: hypothetical protein A2268_02195 [Candidatus Raymondbacteria bacterium RifOxyA12_full_50_37]OGJ92237.1 MAG: hypothetical protein A2248_11025 [Candidatus Raymondbacteria bacterium RIFOXYA2_FULL_49_16]OGJ97853.1 MAG: hypothetical protein A2487_21530 [Candidatus Raymondbacteria bacterium RifOxyC12_full_50_8]OGJ98563.1 MAG: hypothetical protein A2453_06825 [Candidatus Raymondbacteria bacterium RIFOXYC2_FULL_50_21]OGK01864.1 MAG: hypothetical protein A2519_04720 [Candidatus Raymondbacteria b
MHRRIVVVAGLVLLLPLFVLAPSAQRRDYMGYKNIKKRKTVTLPFKSKTLSIPILKMLDENMLSEIMKTGVYDIVNRYPDFNFDQTLAMPIEALDVYKLSEACDVPYLIIPSIEKTEKGSFILTVELHDVRRIVMLHSYNRECPCAFEEVVFQMLPDVANQFAAVREDLPKECPADMKRIDKAAYTMGSGDKYDNNPQVTARVNSFCADKYEFPNKLGSEPMVNVKWAEAHDLCKQTGKRLCTEFEWEYVCRGQYNFQYPYGNQYDGKKCNTDGGEAAKAGAFIDCHGETYVYDLSGNVNEWTGSNWDANIQNKVIRGGGWFAKEKDSRCTLRYSNLPATRAKTIGFRCCISID